MCNESASCHTIVDQIPASSSTMFSESDDELTMERLIEFTPSTLPGRIWLIGYK